MTRSTTAALEWAAQVSAAAIATQRNRLVRDRRKQRADARRFLGGRKRVQEDVQG